MKTKLTASAILFSLWAVLHAQPPAQTAGSPLDSVVIANEASETEHGFAGDDTKTGSHEGRPWRDGRSFEYTLNTHGEKAVDLVVTYWGGDDGREFDVFANGKLLATEQLSNEKPGEFFDRRYPIPADALASGTDGRVTVRFTVKSWVAGGVFDVRLVKRKP